MNRNKKDIFLSLMIFLIGISFGCAGSQQVKEEEIQTRLDKPVVPDYSGDTSLSTKTHPVSNKDRKDETGYLLKNIDIEMKEGKPYLPVGAELVTRDGKVPLDSVIKELADLKGFSVSWADDVDQKQDVVVNIRPEDDFWGALDNVLRQLDYFYEVNKDAIIIKYKETRTYHLAMPFLQENFTTSVGGNLLGGEAAEGKMSGEVRIEANMKDPLDFWQGVATNLGEVIGANGSFVIDRPLGLITVIAPKKTQNSVALYLENLKDEIYKQVIIEAKIIEVRLNNKSEMGIKWSDVLKRTFSGNINFGNLYPYKGVKFIQSATLNPQTFEVLVSALKTYGDTKIISNPKLTLLNGHGATMTVGENITYISEVESTIDTETDVITYDVTTDTILSGIGLGVVANIVDDENVILYIVPLTSELQEPIEYRQFGRQGDEGAEVGLPRVKLRDMATLTKVTDGQTLIIGGLIDKTVDKNEYKTPLLGDLPFIGRLFKYKTEETINRELVILLRPKIITSEEAL